MPSGVFATSASVLPLNGLAQRPWLLDARAGGLVALHQKLRLVNGFWTEPVDCDSDLPESGDDVKRVGPTEPHTVPKPRDVDTS